MEAVRQKKPRPKERSAVREAPPLPTRPAVVHGLRLPEVPTHIPGQSMARSASPEPEDVILSDDESTREVANGEVVGVAEPEPTTSLVEPSSEPAPPTNLIFPRMPQEPSMAAPSSSSEKQREAMESAHTRVAFPAYPTVPQLSTSTDAMAYPLPASLSRLPNYSELELVKDFVKPAAPIVDAPPMYPSLGQAVYERTEHGLLSEQNLLVFYHNPLYETTDEFVDHFVQSEEIPSGPLFSMLRRLKQTSEDIALTEITEKENTDGLSRSFRECWANQQQTKDFKGRCGENKEGQGSVKYQTALLMPGKVTEVKRMLTTNRSLMLDHRLCNESKFRSLALQIQWQVIAINHHFMAENNLSVQSSPCLLEQCACGPGRLSLLRGLSDLFFHLRAPQLNKRFSDAVIGWITELVSALHMSCRVVDSQFVLNHILRLPSPITSWAPTLVQTFIQSQSSAKLKVDYCVTLLSHLMNPIKAREAFLRQIHQLETDAEDAAWTILGDDEEQGDFSMVTIDEADLTAILDQMPISEFYSVAYLHFSTSSPEKSSQFLSTLAFQLLLMKVLDDGLSTYAKPGYKQFCKQIGNSLRQSVRELCSHWRVTKNVIRGEEEQQLQREVDRVMLLALQYLINRDSVGLWQFLVDLPYDCVSEECRNRCELMLRSASKLELKDVYDIPLSEVNAKIRAGGLRERTEALGPLDAVFLVNSLSSIASYSHNDPTTFMKELVEVCFCDETSREALYKVGGEGVATLLSRRPASLDQLLTILDRNIDHMHHYAIDVLASASLTACRVSQAVLSVLGKWLINKAPNDPANRLARRVLSGMYWGFTENGDQLWIDQKVHEICADMVMKAHSVHCGNSNGMIAKSLQKISKMASKMADHEQLFTQFCWDILIKLKLPIKEDSSKTQNDLAAFFIRLAQSSMTNVQSFLDHGVSLLSELISAGSSTASVVLLARIMQLHHNDVQLLGTNKPFMDVLERILQVDQCSFAVQWMTGPSSTPTPIVRLICSSISYFARIVPDVGVYLRAWVELLCSHRMNNRDPWNRDQVTLQILGSIVRIALLKDSKSLLGLPDIIHNLYTRMLSTWRETSKGIFSFLSSDQAPPPLIDPTLLGVSPLASYLLLLVESQAFPQFMQLVYESLAKKDRYTVENAVKKASSKASLSLPVQSLPVYRWASLVPICKEKVSMVYPLVLQRLTTEAYRLRTVNGQKYQFARRFMDSPACETVISECRKTLDAVSDDRGLSRAVSGWLFFPGDVTRSHFDFSQFDLDYLLQLVLADDTNIWLDYVNVIGMQKEDDVDEKLFSATCHLGCKERTAGRGPCSPSSSSSQSRSRAVPFPCLPSHPGLPPAPAVDSSILFQQHAMKNIAEPLIKTIKKLAEEFISGGDKLSAEDDKYCEMIPKLYASVSRNVPITIRCGSRCQVPNNTQTTVTVLEFSAAVDAQMSQNREKRSALWTELFSTVMDRTALCTASLEHVARQVSLLVLSCPPAHRSGAQLSGRGLFYLVTSSLSDTEVLYGSATAAYEHTLRTLGQEFVRNRAEEQLTIMRLVLEGFVLSEPLIEVFTPECLSSTELCDAYTRLSEAVRDPERSQRALKLLGRLGIDQAAASLPPLQFAPLLPLAFNNLASQPDRASELHQLCMQHVIAFVFHAFPFNFVAGLDLALKGCNSAETPPELLQSFVDRLGAEDFATGAARAQFRLPSNQCTECVSILARRLTDARSRLPAPLSVWGRYLTPLTRLSQLFIFTPVIESFHPESPMTVLQRDLMEIFSRVVSLWSPLIAPSSPSLPPFSPSHDQEAVMLLDRFVQLLSSLPHATAIPSGTQNLQSLVWQYYFNKLSILTHGTTHYYNTLDSALSRLHWQSFWPTHPDLSSMDLCLSSRSVDCAPFVAQIFVRVPWKAVLENYIREDNIPSYLATLCSLLTRILSRESNYARVSASLLSLLQWLSQLPSWSLVSPEAAQSLATTIAISLPFDSLSGASEHVTIFQLIWRKVCCFSPSTPFSSSSLLKQTHWLQSQCQLLIRGGASSAVPRYNSLIADVHSVASQHANLRAFTTVCRELTVIWSQISDAKFGECLVSAWNAYLASSPQSPLVLSCLNTVIGSLNQDQLTTAIKVLERTLRTYFTKAGASWSEVLEWVQFPSAHLPAIQNYLLTIPSSASSVQPQYLTLKVFLDYGAHQDSVFRAAHAYIVNTKPKHVTCEPSFLLVIHRLLLWLSRHSASLPSSFPVSDDLLQSLIGWLSKAARDDSNFISNLITSKKSSHSVKMRVVLSIMEQYLTQQSLGEGKRPRCSANDAVLNSRSLKELAATRSFQPFSAAFNLSTRFFSEYQIHHLASAPSLLLLLSQNVFKDRFLTDH